MESTDEGGGGGELGLRLGFAEIDAVAEGLGRSEVFHIVKKVDSGTMPAETKASNQRKHNMRKREVKHIQTVCDFAALVRTDTRGFSIIIEPFDERMPHIPDPVLQDYLGPEIISHFGIHGTSTSEIIKHLITALKKDALHELPTIFLEALKRLGISAALG